jgi:hypothetical protein
MRWLIPLLLLSIVEIYSYQAFKTVLKSKPLIIGYIIISLAILAYIIFFMTTHDRGEGQNRQSLWTIGLMLLVYVPKFVITVIMFGEDIFRFFEGLLRTFLGDDKPASFLPNRRKFISQIALGVAAIPFSSLLYGITIGKYNFKIRKKTLFFDDLPESFDGFKITQISDIHSGSFDDTNKIQYAVDLINEQETDVILFTGDIVNALATEMDPWISTFKGIKTPQFGKFAVLGNHDYGTYFHWDSDEEKDKNFEDIKKIHEKIDFKLMLNEHVSLKKGLEEIKLIGVENWGKHFGEKGDLAKATEGINKEDFKILMSHDPSHWNDKVQHDDHNYHLTLSGHTHGFQFGIEIPGWLKWSPVQYVYKQWAGLYENKGRFIYVNRGFGFHAYPGRVGIMPEITVLELKKGKNVA